VRIQHLNQIKQTSVHSKVHRNPPVYFFINKKRVKKKKIINKQLKNLNSSKKIMTSENSSKNVNFKHMTQNKYKTKTNNIKKLIKIIITKIKKNKPQEKV
jgi:hypothetical protein